MKKKFVPRKFFNKKPVVEAVSDVPPPPCRNLREEFDFVLRTNYKQHVTGDVLRQLWYNAGNLLLKNPSAKIEDIAHQVMADYLGIQTLGTA